MKYELFFRFRVGLLTDDRAIALIEALGMEGLGIYLALLWELRLHPHYRCSFASLSALARRWSVSVDDLLEVVRRFHLFRIYEGEEGENQFSSLYLDEEMAVLDFTRTTPDSSRVSTGAIRQEPAVTVIPVEEPTVKPTVPLTVKRAANGRFTVGTDRTIYTKKNTRKKEEVEEEVAAATAAVAGESSAVAQERTAVAQGSAGVVAQEGSAVVQEPVAALPPSWERYVDSAFGESSWLEVQGMHSGLGLRFIRELPAIIAFFKRHVLTYGKERTILSLEDAKSYFSNFVRQGSPTQKSLLASLYKQHADSQVNDLYRHEQRDPTTGERTYCGMPIPLEAPPRPHANAIWNECQWHWE